MAKKNFYEIEIDGGKRVINVTETTSREIEISGKVYVVPAGVVNFIQDAAGEIEAQQKRRIATDKEINARISGRVDRMLKALAARGMLADNLEADYPLPAGVEADGGKWTFLDEARQVAREGLQNEYKDDLAADIGNENGVSHRKL